MADQTPTGCLFAIFRLFGARSGSTSIARALPYRRKEFLFSKAESSFYGVLNQVAGNEYLIFAKVRLSDLLDIPTGTQSWRAARNRIQSKHVDFLLCRRDGVRPCLAIELNDRSHQKAERIARDQFVEQALSAAKLPLLQIKAARSYSSAQLKEAIGNAINQTK